MLAEPQRGMQNTSRSEPCAARIFSASGYAAENVLFCLESPSSLLNIRHFLGFQIAPSAECRKRTVWVCFWHFFVLFCHSIGVRKIAVFWAIAGYYKSRNKRKQTAKRRATQESNSLRNQPKGKRENQSKDLKKQKNPTNSRKNNTIKV